MGALCSSSVGEPKVETCSVGEGVAAVMEAKVLEVVVHAGTPARECAKGASLLVARSLGARADRLPTVVGLVVSAELAPPPE